MRNELEAAQTKNNNNQNNLKQVKEKENFL